MTEMWMVYRCFRKYFDTVVKPKNAELTEEEKSNIHNKATCNSFLDEYGRCYLGEFPLEKKVLNSPDKPRRDCSCLDFIIRKEYQFLKNVLTKKEVASSKHLCSLESYYDALSFLLKAFKFFSRQAEYAVALGESKLNDEYYCRVHERLFYRRTFS